MDDVKIELENEDSNKAVEQGEKASIWEQGLLFLVMVVVLLVDQLSKNRIENWLAINESWSPSEWLAPYFKITHVSNTGAAFGIFPGGSNVIMIIAVIVSIFIILYNHKLPGGHLLFRVALGLMLGGALGNLIDRVRIDHVTDFIDFGPVPVFNVADASIVCGTILMGFLIFREERHERRARKTQKSENDADFEEKDPTGEVTEDRKILWNE